MSTGRKRRVPQTSDNNSEISQKESKSSDNDPSKRPSTVIEGDFAHRDRLGDYDNFKSDLDEEKQCLLGSTVMRSRRNAICDEIEKAVIDFSGRSLRQRRADISRHFALKQYGMW